MTVVVAGGAGTLGRLVLTELQAAHQPVRALVRDATTARQVLGGDVEIVAADVREPATLRPALAGASVVVSAVHGFLGRRGDGPQAVDRDGNANLVNAAREAGAHVVLVSVVGAEPDSPLDLFRMKFAAEQHLRTSGVPWTIIRATAFLETWISVLQQTRGRSGRPLVFGHGQQPIAFVSARDVAAVASEAATDPRMRGRLIEICGQQQLTMSELAEAVQTAAGLDAPPRHLPRPLLRLLAATASPISPVTASQNRAAIVMDTSQPPGTPRPVDEFVVGRHSTSAADLLSVAGPPRSTRSPGL